MLPDVDVLLVCIFSWQSDFPLDNAVSLSFPWGKRTAAAHRYTFVLCCVCVCVCAGFCLTLWCLDTIQSPSAVCVTQSAKRHPREYSYFGCLASLTSVVHTIQCMKEGPQALFRHYVRTNDSNPPPNICLSGTKVLLKIMVNSFPCARHTPVIAAQLWGKKVSDTSSRNRTALCSWTRGTAPSIGLHPSIQSCKHSRSLTREPHT